MKVTIVAVVEVASGGSVGPDAIHAWAHEALERAGANPIFVAACEGVSPGAVALADRIVEGSLDCPMCAPPIPASVHIPHSTAELPEVKP